MAQKEYRVAVLGRTGRGNYGHGLDVVWKEIPQAKIVGVADDDKQGLAEAARRLGTENAFADYRAMLDEVQPDVVSVAPRWVDQHHDMVVAAAERGIHVYLEKPMCRTLREADEMVAACERSHVKLAIAHQTRYSPKMAVIRQLIEAGRIGEVMELRGRGKDDRRGGGEDLWVLGTHVMDLMRLFFGDALWCEATVTAAGHAVTAADVQEGAEGLGPLAGDSVTASFGMANGVVAHFASRRDMAANPSRFGLWIYGSRGVIELHTGYLPDAYLLEDGSWSPLRTGTNWQSISSAGAGVDEPLSDSGLHGGNVIAVRDLLAAIEEDRQPVSSVYDARAAVEMILAVFESHRQGRRVALPLENRDHPLTSLG